MCKNMKTHPICVLIATSMCRTHSLFSTALNSVLNQERLPNVIIVVDDNSDSCISLFIKNQLASLCTKQCEIVYLRNERTRGMSGTGAWNTGIEYISRRFGDEAYVAILDDDDEWDAALLSCIEEKIVASNYSASAIFPFLKRTDCDSVSTFNLNDLNIYAFLVGNPGVQGSNMCFKVGHLVSIGGFDETLASCTDRDLMIRFLDRFGTSEVFVINKRLVEHHAGNGTVTYDKDKKRQGLTSFYAKHIQWFSPRTLRASLLRAERLFHFRDATEIVKLWKNSNAIESTDRSEVQNLSLLSSSVLFADGSERNGFKPKSLQSIVIGVIIHNGRNTIRRCLKSIFNQAGLLMPIKIVICDDASEDGWQNEVADMLCDGRVSCLDVYYRNVVRTRNALIDHVTTIEDCAMLLRLDADDELAGNDVISKVQRIILSENPDVIIAGNKLRRGEEILERNNYASSELADKSYLTERLCQMANLIEEAELPSCNLMVKPCVLRHYPNFDSAEDHALLVSYLLHAEPLKIFFAENLLYAIYNLNGSETANNRKGGTYQKCRQLLYEQALNKIK